MSAVVELIAQLKQVLATCDAIKTAEIARVATLKSEASRQFDLCWERYNRMQSVVNSAVSAAGDAARQHSESHVLVAEAAFGTERFDLARKTVERFLQLTPQQDQFYCRAKLLMALIINQESSQLNGNALIRGNQKAAAEVMAALDIVTNPKNIARYKFLLFNISAVFWRIVHRFLRSQRAKFFIEQIGRVVAALEEQNDPDREWRIMYLSAAALCCEDAQDAKGAADFIDKAIEHAQLLLNTTLKEEAAVTTELSTAAAEVDRIMSAFRSIEDREELLRKPPKIDPDAPPLDPNNLPDKPELPPLQGLAAEGYDNVKLLLDNSQLKKSHLDNRMRGISEVKSQQLEMLLRLHMQRIAANPADAKRYTAQPQLTTAAPSPRIAVMVQLQSIVSNCVPEKELEGAFTSIVKKLKDLPASVLRNEKLLDVSRTAWRLQRADIALECYKLSQEGSIVSKVLRLKQDICDALTALAAIDTEDANESTGRRLTSKQSEGFFISKRIDALKLLERCTTVCLSIGSDSFLAQEVCVLMWNAIFPLLQDHLRLKVHSCLKAMATVLHAVASPLVLLRMQVHYELSKCEEQADYVMIARDEGVKAVQCDYGSLEHETPFEASEKERLQRGGGENSADDSSDAAVSNTHDGFDRNRDMDHIVKPFVNLLELRSSVFNVPSDAESQAQLWLQQAEESKSKPFIVEMTTKSLFILLDEIKTTSSGSGGRTTASATAAVGASGGSTDGHSISATSVVDWSVMLLRMGTITIPEMSIEEVQQLLLLDRSAPQPSFSEYSNIVHTRCLVMIKIARLGHATASVNLVQQSAGYLLRHIWNPSDTFLRPLIDIQIEACYYLADNMLHRINAQPMLPSTASVADSSAVADVNAIADTAVAATAVAAAIEPTEALAAERAAISRAAAAAAAESDPRCLGLNAATAVSADVSLMKSLVLRFLRNGMELAMSVKDYIAVQNGIIFFWNLHVHIFRGQLYLHANEEVLEFLTAATSMIDVLLATAPSAPKYIQFDQRLRFAVLEATVEWLEAKGELAGALEVAMKGANTTATAGVVEYNRKTLCEAASRLTLTAAATGAATGGKGGKGGKGTAATADPPVFDTSLLNTFATIVQAEQPEYLMPREKAVALTDKAVTLMESTVAKDLEAMPMDKFTLERNGQLQELQVEAWTRLTRLRMIFGDTIGAQYCAEKCLSLVPSPMGELRSLDGGSSIVQTEDDVGPRVWRWVSVCERLFGCAIADIIQPDGQAESLQNELRLVAMEHFYAACQRGLQAKKESLVVEAAGNAWNICIPLVNVSDLRSRLYGLQRKIIDLLLQCNSPATAAAVDELRQQFYLAVIEGYARKENWDKAMKSIMEAFEHVSMKCQKPLWQWRVIAMSKKGKSVLDGIQKLKEGDPSLQAQVFGILARASSIRQQQLESYLQAIDILKFSMERVDYMLELAQWMGSNGIPMSDVSEVLKAAMDAIYEVEEQSMPEIADLDEDEAAELLQSGLYPNATTGTLLLNSELGSVQSGKGGINRGAASQSSRRSDRPPPSAAGTEASRRASTPVHASYSKPKLRDGGDSRRGSKDSVAKQSRRSINSEGKGSGTKRGNSTAGGDASLSPLPEKLDLKMMEQATRSLVMLSMLESNVSLCSERYLEAVFFVDKSLQLWMSALQLAYRKQCYAELSAEDREGTEEAAAIEFDTFHPALPEYLSPPEDAVFLLQWVAIASPERDALMTTAAVQSPNAVPSSHSLPCIPLTVHYLAILAEELHRNCYSKHALRVYAWMKLLLTSLNPLAAGTESVLCMIYFRSTRVLLDLGLDDIALQLSASYITTTSPVTGSKENITAGAYLARIVEDCNMAAMEPGDATPASTRGVASSPVAADRNHSKEDEVTNPFGINTWTAEMKRAGGCDKFYYLLDVCNSLLALGQTSLCQTITLTAKSEFDKRKDARALVECSSIIARLQLLAGRYEDAIATVLIRRKELDAAGDPQQLATHTELIAESHMLLNNPQEAKELSLLTFALLRDAAVLVIDKAALQQQKELEKQGMNAASARTLASTVGTTSEDKRRISTASRTSINAAKSRKIQMEMSRPHALALCQIIRVVGRSLIACTRVNIQAGENAISFYQQFCDTFKTCLEVVVDIVGAPSLLAAELLSLRGSLGAEFLSVLNDHSNTLVSIPTVQYQSWLDADFKQCVDSLEGAYDMYRLISADIPAGDLRIESTAISAATRETSKHGESGLPYRLVSIPVHRMLALTQIQLAGVKSLRAMLLRQHLSSNDFSDPPDLNIVEEFLELTKLPPKFHAADFQVPILNRASTLLSEAASILKESERLLPHCQLLAKAVAVLRRSGLGEYDCMWRPRRPKLRTPPSAAAAAVVSNTSSAEEKSEAVGEDVAEKKNVEEKKHTGKDKVTAATVATAVVAATADASAESAPIAVVKEPPMILGESGLSVVAKADQEQLSQRVRNFFTDASASVAISGDFTCKIDRYRAALFACLALCESHGLHESKKSAQWLLHLQSVVAAKWLASIWRQYALNPTSEIAAAFSRAERLLNQETPNKESLKQLQTELLLLEENSVAFRRLSVASDPSSIFEMCPPKTVLLCLQYDPLKTTLYLCAGQPHPPPLSATTAATAKPAAAAAKKGAVKAPIDPNAAALEAKRLNEFWIVDKLQLDESIRRELQTITQQHKVWLADMTKFIAVNGDSAPSNFDLVGDNNAKYLGKTLRKAEHALEERLRALIGDLERCLAPLIGPDSKVNAFVRSLLYPQSSYAKQRHADHEQRVRDGIVAEPSADADATTTTTTTTTAANSTSATSTATAVTSIITESLGPKNHLSLLLLIDPSLLSLPWEAVNLVALFDGKVTRDFSLHMYHHRLVTLHGGVRSKFEEDVSPAEATAKFTANALTNSSHGAAAISLPPSAVKYLVDPLNEDPGIRMKGYQRKSILKTLDDLVITLPPAAGAAGWNKIRSEQGVVSVQDFLLAADAVTQQQSQLEATSTTATTAASKGKGTTAATTGFVAAQKQAMLVYTLGRFGSILSPLEVASINMEPIAFMCCLDMANNDTSNRRQISGDVLKKTKRIEAEQPLLMAAVLSLSGVGSLLMHSWSVPINSQNRFLSNFIHHFTNNSAAVIHASAAAPLVEGKMQLTQALALTNHPPGTEALLVPEAAASAVAIAPSADSLDEYESRSLSRVNSMLGSATVELAADEAAAAAGPKAIKAWVRLARVLFGVGHITYN